MSLKCFSRVCSFIFFFISCFFIGYFIFADKTFGHASVDQILFHARTPKTGADKYLFCMAFVYAFLLPVFMFILLWAPSYLCPSKYKLHFHLKKYENQHFFQLVFSVFIFILAGYSMDKSLNISEYLRNIKNPTTLYENYFVTPDKAGISFDKEKKNIVMIYLESMENTYGNGTVFKDNILPNLTNFEKEGQSFKGFRQLNGTQWTIAGIFSSLCGAPIKTPIEGVRSEIYEIFMPGIVCIPELLQKNGYNNYFLLGSDASFAGRQDFFNWHGFPNFWGMKEIKKEKGEISKEMLGSAWGLNDHELFKIAKQKLTEISKNKELFFFAILTVDTHFPNGYLNEKECQVKYNNFLDVVKCSDKEVGNFVNWIKKQSFADNTVIILVGDHITMGNDVFNQIIKNPKREIVNIFIEPTGRRNIQENREFSTMDLAPTILALTGADIETNAFGLGRNLFSKEPTLLEVLGENFITELERFSKYYQTFFPKDVQKYLDKKRKEGIFFLLFP